MGVGSERPASTPGGSEPPAKKPKFTAYSARDETPVETAVEDEWDAGRDLVKHLPQKAGETMSWVPALANALFCGHVVTDLDSIAGAIGAAELYGGTPARASEINSETQFALEHWGVDLPAPVEDLLAEKPDRNVCLVDFQQQTQLNEAIPMGNIVGIIDHHALQSNTIVTEKPIFVDIRPWGCMSSIIAHSYAVQGHYLPRNIAGMLLSAILSDTLNLRSPTTTDWDRRIVAMLVQYVGVEDINELAAKQFRAKSHQLTLMSPYALVVGDMKQFRFTPAAGGDEYVIGYSVIETTDAPSTIARVADILPEMRAVRKEKSLTGLLLAVVDIVNLHSTLLVCGRAERSLALAAYGGECDAEGETLDLGGLVSRKQDFIPPLTRAVKEGWVPPPVPADGEVENKGGGSAMKRSKSLANIARGKVTVDYSQSASGVITRK